MPVGWMIDRQGAATTPRAEEGFRPIGGQGYGRSHGRRPAGRHAQRRRWAAKIDFSKDKASIPSTGQSHRRDRPRCLWRARRLKARVDKLVRELRASGMPGVDRIRMPSERQAPRQRTRARAAGVARKPTPRGHPLLQDIRQQQETNNHDPDSPSLSGLAAGLLCAGVQAQSNWPNKPIRMIVPLAAGSAATTRRASSPSDGAQYGQSIVIENQPGAAGLIGRRCRGRAAPVGPRRLQRQHHDHGAQHEPQDALGHSQGLRPVSVATAGGGLVVNAEAPEKSAADLIASAKRR
jgi:hypothetical protein